MICSWARLIISNVSETRQSSWSGSSVFALEKWFKYLNFKRFFTSNRPFGGYFQWNVCTYFQKIGTWTGYSAAKLIKNISNILVTLLHFSFRKQPKNLNIQSFTPFRPFGGYLQWTRAPTSRKYVSGQAVMMPNWSKTFQTFWSHFFVFTLKNNIKI